MGINGSFGIQIYIVSQDYFRYKGVLIINPFRILVVELKFVTVLIKFLLVVKGVLNLFLKFVLYRKSIPSDSGISIGVKIEEIYVYGIVSVRFSKYEGVGNTASFVQEQFEPYIGIKAFILSLVIPNLILKT